MKGGRALRARVGWGGVRLRAMYEIWAGEARKRPLQSNIALLSPAIADDGAWPRPSIPHVSVERDERVRCSQGFVAWQHTQRVALQSRSAGFVNRWRWGWPLCSASRKGVASVSMLLLLFILVLSLLCRWWWSWCWGWCSCDYGGMFIFFFFFFVMIIIVCISCKLQLQK